MDLDLFGRPIRTAKTKAEEVAEVFDVWKTCIEKERVRLTKDRAAMIRARLNLGYSSDDFVALIKYMFESNEREARWMRGENPRGKPYLDLTSLLRVKMLARRVEDALEWQDAQSKVEEVAESGLDLGVMGAFYK